MPIYKTISIMDFIEAKYYIGDIDFSSIIEEDTMGSKKFSGIRTCKVEVYSAEGQIPHMHIFKSDKKFETCVCIYSSEYFAHGGKYTQTFSSGQRKVLNNWMKEIRPDGLGLTHWQAIMVAWETMHKDCKYPDKLKVSEQPDYTKLHGFREKI